MIKFFQNTGAFSSFDKAARSLPRNGPTQILVFNIQGLPILQFARDGGVSAASVESLSAFGVKFIHEVFESLQSFIETEPKRMVYIFDEDVITIERDGPFVFFITWTLEAFKLPESSEKYIKRLGQTLHEELT